MYIHIIYNYSINIYIHIYIYHTYVIYYCDSSPAWAFLLIMVKEGRGDDKRNASNARPLFIRLFCRAHNRPNADSVGGTANDNEGLGKSQTRISPNDFHITIQINNI